MLTSFLTTPFLSFLLQIQGLTGQVASAQTEPDRPQLADQTQPVESIERAPDDMIPDLRDEPIEIAPLLEPERVTTQATENSQSAEPSPPAATQGDPVIRVPSAAEQAARRTALIDQAKLALSSVETARGRFTQINPEGTIDRGSYAIRRPGRVRFDYDGDASLLIVADGSTVALHDRELDSIERVPLGSTPMSAILASDLDFDSTARVIDVVEGENAYYVTVVDPKGEYEGSLSLAFSLPGNTLEGWITQDGLNRTTQVILEDTETNIRLNPALFRLEDARDDRDRRDRR